MVLDIKFEGVVVSKLSETKKGKAWKGSLSYERRDVVEQRQ